MSKSNLSNPSELQPIPHEAADPSEGGGGMQDNPTPVEGRRSRKSLVPLGNRPRWGRGGALTIIGGGGAFVIMATEAQSRWGVPLGILFTLVAVLGTLDLLGSFDDPDDRVAHSIDAATFAPHAGLVLAALAATLTLIGLAAHGTLPLAAAAVLIPTAFLSLVVTTFRAGVRIGAFRDHDGGERGGPRPLFQRHGFWVIVTGTLLYLPMQGSYSLSDPWETHYGEVARELLSRNDWISTWWAQDGWFWSKPVLDFWMQALAMGIFGVHYKPGEMLLGSSPTHLAWPEWAVRMPVFVLTIVGLYFLYKGVANVFGRRAGLIGAIILATMPQWFLLAHQTITDMPLVATLSATMGLLLIGIHTDESRTVRAYEIRFGRRTVRVSAYHLVFGIILMTAIPQALYLFSRNIEFDWHMHWFRVPRLDEFWSGSKGNCGLPGNEACTRQTPAYPAVQPWMEGLGWTAMMGIVLAANWGERRVSRLCFLAGWYFAAIATMGKGPAGFGLPICVTFTYIAATRNWRKLLTLEILTGLLIIAAVALPWYVAMYLRHGQPFTDRLIFHDMYKRAMTHVHDTNEGDDVSFRFFIWQLGYALFPWTGLVPAALVWWARKRDDAAGGKGDVSVFLAMWFIFAFALFTAMLTKFHHYIFPAVPPAAMLTGILVDRMIGDGALAKPRALALYLGGLGLSGLLLVYSVIRMFPGSVLGDRAADNSLHPPSMIVAGIAMVVGLTLAALTIHYFGKAENPNRETGWGASVWAHEERLIGAIAIGAAVVAALAGRDMFAHTEPGDSTSQARLLHLFTYNYRRPWPESLEFTGTITAFTIVVSVLVLLLAVRTYRRHFAVMLLATACWWALWGEDIYWVKCAPHWGQREVIAAYYTHRKSAEEPLVAYQMNWKGENFYAGNQIPAFVSSGATFTAWLKQQQEKGQKTFYFVAEHGRLSSLRSEAGNPKGFDQVTDKRVNNKFVLVKATFD